MPRSFVRYTVVGAAATLAHWLVLAGLVEGAAWAAGWASAAGAVVGAQVAFVGHRRFTFAPAPGALPALWPAWWRFQATAAGLAVLGVGLVVVATAAGWHHLAAQALATGVVWVVGHAVNRCWAFGRSTRRRAGAARRRGRSPAPRPRPAGRR